MDELKSIIQSIVPDEIQQDEGVKARSYVLDPFLMESVLDGDGKPQEIATSLQLDVFFKGKGELTTKANKLIEALGNYSIGSFTFTWESSARLWRGTLMITII